MLEGDASLFKPFEDIKSKADEKQLVAYIQDATKHLEILSNGIAPIKKDLADTFLELGFIRSVAYFDECLNLTKNKLNYSEDKLDDLFSLIDHSNGLCVLPKICKTCRKNLQLADKNANKPTVIDLFCGSGGMSLGFTQSGYKIIFANDIEPSCIETYSYNHPEVNPNKIVLGDIQNFAKTVSAYTDQEHVDVVIGGPPCQGFSNANKQRVIDDPRNRLYKEFVEVVASVRPTFFVMENVIGMKEIAHQICEDFENIGYKVSYEVLNAVDFGVAQQRKRIIFIGNKVGINNNEIFKKIANQTQGLAMKSLAAAIDDLPNLEALTIKNATEYESDKNGYVLTKFNTYIENDYRNRVNNGNTPKFLYNHKARYNNDRDIEIFSRLDQGDKSDDPKIADIMPYASRNDIFKDKYFKLVYTQPCKTITAHMKFDCNMYIHPTQARGLTPREAARVQSYPDDYYFKGSFTKTYMQIGNSVPPLMARGIAGEIKKYLKEVQLQDEQLNFSLRF